MFYNSSRSCDRMKQKFQRAAKISSPCVNSHQVFCRSTVNKNGMFNICLDSDQLSAFSFPSKHVGRKFI